MRFSLTFELKFGQIVLETLNLEFVLVVFGLEDSPMISLFFNVFSILDY